jgi:hypothetical protein
MVVSSLAGAYFSNQAAKDASAAQTAGSEAGIAATREATQLGIAEQRRQFNESMAVLNPYVMAGYEALGYDPIGVEQLDAYKQQLGGYSGIAGEQEEISPLFEDNARPGAPPVPFDEYGRPTNAGLLGEKDRLRETGLLRNVQGSGLRVKGGSGSGIQREKSLSDFFSPLDDVPGAKYIQQIPGVPKGDGMPHSPLMDKIKDSTAAEDAPVGSSFAPMGALPPAAPIAPKVGAFNPNRGLGLYRSAGETGLPILGEYAEAGRSALQGQRAIAGELGPEAQQAAIEGIQGGPEMSALVQQGENALLQNASATGGMRGGNTSAALAQFRPQILSQLMNKQYSRLGGLSAQGGNIAQYLTGAGQSATSQVASMGQAAAAGQASMGQATGQGIANLLSGQGAAESNLFGQIGSANAGRSLARGQAINDAIGGVGKAYGYYKGL